MSVDADRPDFVASQPVEGVRVLAVLCEVDCVTAAHLRELLVDELAAAKTALVLDFSDCEFMGSAGLAVLLHTRDRADACGVALVVVGLNRIGRRALEATALISLFRVAFGVEGALTTVT